MTQKELLYVEDAIGHEETLITVLENMATSLEEEDLVDFCNQELETHTTLKEDLMALLEGNAND